MVKEQVMNSAHSETRTSDNVYLVATIRPWNIAAFRDTVKKYPGEWHLVTDPKQLTPGYVAGLSPRYIFFPHWSHMVPGEILALSECVCFHETDLPYGRGGSPIQNLIARGHRETQITALKMVTQMDAGPVYMKRPLSLEGSAHSIFIRASAIVAEMMLEIAQNNPVPAPQQGEPVLFRRRTPAQSEIVPELKTVRQLYDHIRMLDAPEYPRAFINVNDLQLIFESASLNENDDELTAKVTIKVRKND